MIATISPTDISYGDTNNTLKYANRAKNIHTRLVCNIKRSHSYSTVAMNNKNLTHNIQNVNNKRWFTPKSNLSNQGTVNFFFHKNKHNI